MAMVSNKFLGAVAVELSFERHLAHNGTLSGQIVEYARQVKRAIFGDLSEQRSFDLELSDANVDSWECVEEVGTHELPVSAMDYWV